MRKRTALHMQYVHIYIHIYIYKYSEIAFGDHKCAISLYLNCIIMYTRLNTKQKVRLDNYLLLLLVTY